MQQTPPRSRSHRLLSQPPPFHGGPPQPFPSSTASASANGYHLTTHRPQFSVALGWLLLLLSPPSLFSLLSLLSWPFLVRTPSTATATAIHSSRRTTTQLCPIQQRAATYLICSFQPLPATGRGSPLSELSFANPSQIETPERLSPSPSQEIFIHLHI
jgi:hypothetical protein